MTEAAHGQKVSCKGCGNQATVHAHTGPSVKSKTEPRCKDRACSRVCTTCWMHFVPDAIDKHMNEDAGYGFGCVTGPLPDPLAKKNS